MPDTLRNTFLSCFSRRCLIEKGFSKKMQFEVSGQHRPVALNNHVQLLRIMFNPNSQCPHTNSPDWSSYISLKNQWREFDKSSRNFTLLIMLLILMAFSLDCVSVILLPLRPASLTHRNPHRHKIVAVNNLFQSCNYLYLSRYKLLLS